MSEAVSNMGVIRTLADVEALEARPYDTVVPHQSTYGLIAQSAARFPGRDAFRFLPDGDLATPAVRVGYAALLAQVHRAANFFEAMGVGLDDAVAILAPNMPQTHFALWGAQVVGRACPINYLLHAEHIAALLVAAKAKLIVALGPNEELNLWPLVQKLRSLSALPVIQIRVDGEARLAANADAPGVPVFQDEMSRQPSELKPEVLKNMAQSRHRIAAFFHTGGTTGAPKLAQHTHGNEVHTSSLAPLYYGYDQNTVQINGFPLFHVAGAFVYGLSVLAVGGTQILPTLSGMRDAGFVKNYWKFCEREKVTALACVPTVLATLLNTPVDADISSVRVAYTGGSPLPRELAVQFESRLPIAVRNILGMTESAGLVAIEPAASSRVPGSVGLRLPYTRLRVLPWQQGQVQLDGECRAGETGVVAIQGPHVSPGYTDPARNGGMFEALAPSEFWLVSGDLGHVDEAGYLHITGRAKDVIIRSAHNLDPGLVEEAFLAHPAVAMCAVVGEPDAYAGELPVAFVALKQGHSIDAARLLNEVSPNVYERPAVPKRLTIVDALPMTAVGKIFKPELRLRAIEVKLAEMLQGVCDGRAVVVRAEDASSGQVAVIQISGSASEALAAQVRQCLASISVVQDIRFG